MKVTRVQDLNIQPQKVLDKISKAVDDIVSKPEELPKIPSETLKAYSGIKSEIICISKSEFKEWLSGTPFKRTNLFDTIYENICDENGQLSKEAFELFKSFEQKGHSVMMSMNIFSTAKENGKINYRALKLVDRMMEHKKSPYYSSHDIYTNMLKNMKNKEGKFEESIIEIFEKDIPTFKLYMERYPEGVFKSITDGEGNFSREAIEYFKKHLDNKEKIQDIIHDLFSAKNVDGTIDIDNIALRKKIKEIFSSDHYSINEIVMNSPKEHRQNIIETATKIKDEEHFNSIIYCIKSLNLEFNDANINFSRKISNITNGQTKYIDIIVQKLQPTPEILDEYGENLLKNLCKIFSPENLEKILECAAYKTGKNKGVIDLKNLERYKEIYSSNYSNMQFIQDLSSKLSLEEDDQALKTLHKLYTMKFPSGTNDPDTLNRNIVDFVVELSTMCDANNIPKRKIPKQVLDNIEKLLSMKYTTQSKEVLENFLVIPDFKAIEMLERVKLSEVGIKEEQASKIFQSAEENKLLKFKEFIRKYRQDNKIKDIDIEFNQNFKNRLEITSGTKNEKNVLIYDFEKLEPVTNLQIKEDFHFITKSQHDFANNTVTEIKFRKKNIGYYHDLETLEKQTIIQLDSSGNEIFREIMERSNIPGVPNIKKVYPDGKEEIICKAFLNKDGHEVIEKNMTSLDGTKSFYRRESDNQKNCITDYVIKNKDGKTLYSQSSTYEIIDENHYRTSKNGIAYDVKFNNNTIEITNENTKQTRIIDINTLAQDSDESIVPLLKQISGEELFKIDEIGLKNIKYKKYSSGAHYSSSKKEIVMGKDMISDGIFLHEFGHSKDHLLFEEINERISNDPELQRIYKQECETFKKHFSEAQLDLVGYFTSEHHYAGNALIEGIAETNTLLNTYPHNEIQNVRAHYWQQYFPNTIAYVAKLLN